ncbi:hypothetical protein [Rhodoferax sp. TS-BS-61-7]|uniref:hypothetical protein n=1 Tax=Rhodoferax sp. TS-BS-61-7 TaxID=2094194 RepID=UPI000CF66C51|nr:hypothetical protein [Rhodoferax sp. TS-BS-61-7]PQA79542.1 hypothetical protein C5F53_04630 [Rhodoferax sp. TS-BS-61-7]
MTRQFLRSVAGVLIGVLLFAQMAIAAYVCPGVSVSANTQMPSMEMVKASSDTAAMPIASNQATPCASMGEDIAPVAMDSQNANLCVEHCKVGQQSDQASTLTVPAVLLMALYFAPLVPAPVAELPPVAATPSALVAASPPHTILHCCFRI